jgi:nicotinamidase-related amidase
MQLLLSLLPFTSSQLVDTSNSITAVAGTGDPNSSTLGNYYNYWSISSPPTARNAVYDLTRSARMPTTNPVTIPMSGSRRSATIEPSRSALVIIDMQNFFLHPGLSPRATGGRAAVAPTVALVQGFRAAGMPVLWTNWGLDDFDLLTIPPSFLAGFSDDNTAATTFGSQMGLVPNTSIDAGRKLWRGSWNAQPYGPLYPLQTAGVAAGTDYYFHKNRLSGLWGAQTPLGLWLQENEITTLFFGGVNADQCVWGTFLDAYYKGFDVVYVDDISATTSPQAATDMVRYNANCEFPFFSNSCEMEFGGEY